MYRKYFPHMFIMALYQAFRPRVQGPISSAQKGGEKGISLGQTKQNVEFRCTLNYGKKTSPPEQLLVYAVIARFLRCQRFTSLPLLAGRSWEHAETRDARNWRKSPDSFNFQVLHGRI